MKRAVEELSPYLNWRTKADLARTLKERASSDRALDRELRHLSEADPAILEKILRGLDFKKLSPEDFPEVARQVSGIAEVLVGADRQMRLAIEEIVKRLPSQGKKATQGLADLMEQLTLRQITAVSAEVHRRMEVLTLFKKRMLDDRTYEIRGENSIHRLLESAMWIVDERWWLMHSNETLRTQIGRDLAKSDRRLAKKRPDFVCGTLSERLIIVELKRPKHILTVEDLNQLETYVRISEKYSSMSLEAAILVGRKKSDELSRTTKYRSRAFKVLTYDDLVRDTEHRYKAYIDVLAVR